MAKFIADVVLENGINYIKNNGTEIYVCSQQPTDYTTASSTYALAGKTGLTSGSYTGPADGDTSGRKLTKNAESSVSIGTTGDGDHVAICSSDTLLCVTTFTSQTLTSGNTCNIAAFDIEFADVTP